MNRLPSFSLLFWPSLSPALNSLFSAVSVESNYIDYAAFLIVNIYQLQMLMLAELEASALAVLQLPAFPPPAPSTVVSLLARALELPLRAASVLLVPSEALLPEPAAPSLKAETIRTCTPHRCYCTSLLYIKTENKQKLKVFTIGI